MEPREPGDPADGSETEKSLAALFFYFVLEKWFSIEERLSPLHWSGCHRSIETYKPPSTNIYPEFCDALTQVLKKTIYKP